MNAISSFRPFGQDAQWDANQLAAALSWREVFDRIIYLNAFEPKLAADNVVFLGGTEHPTIKSMCEIAAVQPDWTALVNADIVIAPRFRAVEAVAKAKNARALVSYRYDVDTRTVIDNGLDFFAATPTVWLRAARAVPPQFRLGHQLWDTWMMDFLNRTCGRHFYDFTKQQCVFHPKHEGRRFVFKVGDWKPTRGYYGLPRQEMTM